MPGEGASEGGAAGACGRSCQRGRDCQPSGEGEGAAEALCGRLATEALDRVEAMLLKAVRVRYASEKERMVEMALQTVAEEG